MSRERGSVLIVAVWMLAILFLLTMSLSRRANQELLLVKYSLQKMQARYLAWAGFHYATAQIREELTNEKTDQKPFSCDIKFAEGQASCEMSNEDNKLNLNALNLQNYRILKELLVIVGVQESQALQIAVSAVDWRDEDQVPVWGVSQTEEGPFGLGEQRLPAKNRPFDSLYELMFLKEMTPEIYEKVKSFVTVYPRRASNLKVNLSTASREVLLALARNFTGPLTNTSAEDADSLVNKILVSRAGLDKIEGTVDDQPITEKNLNITMTEKNVFRALSQVQIKNSRFVSMRVTGVVNDGQRQSHISAVLDRETLTVLSWRND